MSTLEKYDADEPYYIGYAFLAAAHLEGVIEGVRRPVMNSLCMSNDEW